MKTGTKIIRVLIIVLNTFSFGAFAQDTITMVNGNETIAKVLEISSEEVKFKKFNNQDGPTYLENKSNVVSIKYRNGLKDEFKFEKPWLQPSESAVQAVPEIKKYPRLTQRGINYLYDDRRLNEREMQSELLLLNNTDLNDHIHKAKLANGLQYIGFAAIPLAMIGGLVMINEGLYYGNNNNNYNTAGIFFGLAAVSIGTSIHFKVQRIQHDKAAIKLYNQTY